MGSQQGSFPILFCTQTNSPLCFLRTGEKNSNPRLLTPLQNRWFKITSAGEEGGGEEEGGEKNPYLVILGSYPLQNYPGTNGAKYTPFSLLLYN